MINSDDRTESEHVSQRRRGGGHRVGDARLGPLHLGVEDADVVEDLLGELEALTLRRGGCFDAGEHGFGLRDHYFFADPTGYELVDEGVEAAARTATRPAR